jgi:trimethylamine--corrinoid protein Co-methyltransferase
LHDKKTMDDSRDRLEILTKDQVRQIHETALRVLGEVGLWMPHREVLERFHAAGAQVDFKAQTVRVSGDLAERHIRQFPSGFTWHARNPANSLAMDGSETHFSFPDSAINLIDLDGRRRPGTPADGEDICRLCDALPELVIASTGVTPPEMPSGVLEAWHTRTMFTHSSKPVFGVCRNEACSQMILRMAEVVADGCALPAGQLPLAIITNPVSPLFNTPDQLAGMLEYLYLGLPITISPEVQAGATGPATLAGTLVLQTAEFLGHAILAQIIHPGTPVLYGTVSSVFDMQKMMLPYGAPEADLLGIATVQIAHHYGIPARTTGGSSDANALGMQAGVDSLMSTLLSILAGSTFVLHGAGELENTLAVSHEKILIDEEIIRMARRLARGIEVTPETLGFDVIQEVGPQGHFLDTNHTYDHFRTEQFMPRLMVRDKYDMWEAAGGKRAEELARDRARDLLAGHQPEPLPERAMRELEAIYNSFVQQHTTSTTGN